MSEIIAVFLKTTLEDNEKLNQVHRISRCGNLVPLNISEQASLKKFTGTKAVDWPDSEIIDESRLPDETDQSYDTRMLVAVNTALADLQSHKNEASIMSVSLFVSARGGL